LITTTAKSSRNGALTTTSATTGDPLAAYNYLGIDTVIKEDYSVPRVKLDYAGSTAGTYPGLDQFDRVVDQKWTNSSGTIDEEKEGYNAQGNVAYKQNATLDAYSAANPSLGLKALDQVFGYIGLGELNSLAQGQIATSSGNVTVDSLGDASLVSGTENFSQGFTLDSAGNNTQVTTTGTQTGTGGDSTVTQDRQVNGANQIQNYNDDTDTSTSTWAVPGYDSAGNMTTTPQPGNETTALTCIYDAWGHLDEVLNGTTVLATYQYDGNGSLIVVDENGVTTDRYYANGQLLESIDRAPTSPTDGATYMTEQYVWSASNPNSLISRTQTTFTYSTSTSSWSASTPTAYFYLSDANNNVTAVTNSSGVVQERYAYGAYGTVTVYSPTWTVLSATAINNTFFFSTMQVDAQTGLSYVNARWYSTSLAIFITTDPALSSRNLYAYAMNDPTTLNDPSGLYVGATVATDSDHAGPCNGEQGGDFSDDDDGGGEYGDFDSSSNNPWDPMDTRTDGSLADDNIENDPGRGVFGPDSDGGGTWSKDGPDLAIGKELLKRIQSFKSLANPSDNLLIRSIIVDSLILANGDPDKAWAAILDVRGVDWLDDDTWASADHFFQTWSPLAVMPGSSLKPIRLIYCVGSEGLQNLYSGLKIFDYTRENWIPRDNPTVPPSPITVQQWKVGEWGIDASYNFNYGKFTLGSPEWREFLEWLDKEGNGLNSNGVMAL
jgi:RHS repeat-associated protein